MRKPNITVLPIGEIADYVTDSLAATLRRVLLVVMDPQGNATLGFGIV